MHSVAERFILRPTAAAQRHAVSDFVNTSVGAFDFNAAFDKQGAAALCGGIFQYADFFFQFRFHQPARFVVFNHQPAGRTGQSFAQGQSISLS